MLHKFNYVPIAQPILAHEVVRFVGEPIAAVLAATRGGSRGHRRARRGRDRADASRWSMRAPAIAPGAAAVHGEAPGNVIVEGRVKTPGFDAKVAACGAAHRGRYPLAPAERAAARAARRACGLGSDQPARDAALHDPDAARDAHHHRRTDRHAGIRPAGDRARCRRRLRPEDVARARVRAGDVARAQAQDVGGVDRGPARKPRRLLPQPRSVRLARRRVRRRRQAASRCRPTSSPMSAPIRAIRPPAASSR